MAEKKHLPSAPFPPRDALTSKEKELLRYPLPWNVLTYDTDQGGYVINLDKSVLEKAPRFNKENEPAFDRTYGREIYGYYGVTYPF